ncbi:MAG TPA: ATP-binding protein [Rhodocyclaceae bacterium]|nr:ATP-binding protein [Rhodocyclaceae bacterium]
MESFWRSLRYFSFYRLFVALLFLGTALVFGEALSLGSYDFRLYRTLAFAYSLLAVGFLVLLLWRPPRFNFLLSLQVTTDILALTLMMYTSGGQKSGIAALLLVVVAGAGLVGQGKMALFYAALASVLMLLEQGWRTLALDADPADFVRTGFICIAFFGSAVAARLLSQRVVANEVLARERGRELDEQLRISERIIRDMDDGVLVVDADGSVRLLNPRAQSLLNASAADCSTLDALSDALSGRYDAWSRDCVEVAEMLRVDDGRLVRVRYLPPADRGGKTLIYLEDMDRVQAQARQLKLAALGRLAANMAHEIRNPLAAISHAAELLAEDDVDLLRNRLARIIHDNTRRLNRIVTDVLELGRRDRAQPEVLRWQTFIAEFMEEFSLHDASASRRVQVVGDGLELRFDRGHLYRVLWNLLGNALRHASAQTGAVRIEARSGSDPSLVELHIADDGEGIDKALHSQVFEPFFTTHGAGTGLGLYIARELCEANGANLELLDSALDGDGAPGLSGAHFCIVAEGRLCR